LISDSSGLSGEWKVASITAYSGALTDKLNSRVLAHHKDVGSLNLSSDGTGMYTYKGTVSNLDWNYQNNSESDNLALDINVNSTVKVESYFLYYHIGGLPNDFYYNQLGKVEQAYDLRELDPNTLQLRILPEYFSSAGTYSYELILIRL